MEKGKKPTGDALKSNCHCGQLGLNLHGGLWNPVEHTSELSHLTYKEAGKFTTTSHLLLLEGYSGERGVNPSAFQILLLQSEKGSARRVTDAYSRRFWWNGNSECRIGKMLPLWVMFCHWVSSNEACSPQLPQSSGNF